MNYITQVQVNSEEEMRALGRQLVGDVASGDVVYLGGELGVGKTTLARAMITAWGYLGRIKSPSYGLIEVYPMPDGGQVAHLDLYRLEGGEALYDLGLESYLNGRTIVIIEWPERATGYLPDPNWQIHISDGHASGCQTAPDPDLRQVVIQSKRPLTKPDPQQPNR